MQEIGAKSGKIDRLIHLLDETQPHIVILREHGLKESEVENTRLPKYSLKTHFSRLHHRKGGVAIYIIEDLKEHVEPLDITHHSNELICELAVIKITLGKEHLFVMGFYRTPTARLDDALDILSSTLEKTGAEKHTHTRLKTKVLHAGIADHTAQFCEFQIQGNFPCISSTMDRVFNQRNMDSIKEKLKNEDWNSVFYAPTAEEAYIFLS
ncbi:hypothetical protein J6590_072984 [Homalodisca vitripennis]|nr:hypothetical protein J6590_072984 [Homalodisca vitripennis]